LGWLFVVALSAMLTAVTICQSLRQYDELQSGWSWDLAYYNQWFWSLTHGAREVTVRPVSAYAQEGPSIWKMNYLAPIRLVLVPFYLLAPDPRTLLVIQSIVFWWVIPAAYTLVRAESRSEIVAVSAAALVPFTPLLWPLVWNDFRELQLAAPFVLWAINGVRARSAPLAALGVAGMLACRQEFAVIVATFCILPPREGEPRAARRLASGLSRFILAWVRALFPPLEKGGPGGVPDVPTAAGEATPPSPPLRKGGKLLLVETDSSPWQPEPLDVSLRWRRATLLGGTIWLLFGFFVYLRFVVGRGAADAFIDQFLGPKASLAETLVTSSVALFFGLGAWAFLACLAPRVALLAVPWIWGLCNGRWAMRLLEGSEWHSVRYVVPMVVMVLAAGLIGYARLGSWLLSRRGGRVGLAVVWLASVAICGVGLHDVLGRLSRVSPPLDGEEVREIWSWVREVGPDDAVMADYTVSAPLSSRRQLYSYILDANLPKGFPVLTPEFRWLFIRNDYWRLGNLLEQNFKVVHRGPVLTIARRFDRDGQLATGN